VSLQVLEVVAHTLFLELACRLLAAPGGSSLALLGVWMRDLLARDEARHLAFGQLYLTALLQRHPERTVQADHKLEELYDFLLTRAVPYFLGELSGMGFDGGAMLRRGAHDLRERFHRAGLRAQMPALP
jgi:hypothetical protein